MQFAFKTAVFFLGAILVGAPAYGLSLDPPEILFGSIAPFESVRQEILLINESEEPVDITRISSVPAGLLTIHLDQDQVAPGEVAVLSVTLQAGREEGFIESWILVESGQDSEPHEISVCAEVESIYRIRGGPLFFENLRLPGGREPRVASVSAISPGTPALRAGRIEVEHFNLDVHEPATPGGPQTLVVTPGESVPEGWHYQVLEVPASEPGAPPFRFQVASFLPPPVHVYPDELQVMPSRREQVRMLFIDSYLEEPVDIERVETPGPAVRWEFAPDGFLDRLRINLYFTRDWDESMGNEVVVHLSNAGTEPVRIPIRATARNDISIPYPQTVAFIASRSRCGCVR